MDEGEAFTVALGEKEAVMHSGQGLMQSRYPNQPGCWQDGTQPAGSLAERCSLAFLDLGQASSRLRQD